MDEGQARLLPAAGTHTDALTRLWAAVGRQRDGQNPGRPEQSRKPPSLADRSHQGVTRSDEVQLHPAPARGLQPTKLAE